MGRMRIALLLLLLQSLIGCVSSSTLELKVTELHEARKNMEKLQEDYSTLRRQEAKVSAERDRLNVALKNVVQDKEILELKVEELQKRLEASKQDTAALEDKAEELKENLKSSRGSLSSQIAELIDQTRRLSEDNTALLGRIDDLTGKSAESRKRIESLSLKISEQNTEINTLATNLDEKESTIKKLSANLHEKNIEIKNLKARLLEKDTEIKGLKEKVQEKEIADSDQKKESKAPVPDKENNDDGK